MSVTVHHGDCLDVLRGMGEASVDSCCTDPPYGLGFMGRGWDHGVPGVPFWAEVLRVMKPGAHLVAFGGCRTYHRMVCAIEDAGFEIRDQLAWLYGTGFSKVGYIRDPSTKEIVREGWAGSLKPAHEPIVLARKPLACPTVAAQVLATGTGALNVDGCRVPAEHGDEPLRWEHGRAMGYHGAEDRGPCRALTSPGRWPANLVHDGSPEVLAAFAEQSARMGMHSAGHDGYQGKRGRYNASSYEVASGETTLFRYGDTGTAARFFPALGFGEDELRFHYSAKASKAERAGSKHPTVKPLALMRWLCRLVTPPGGVVLDCFAGTGVTGEAALLEGFGAILIEREAEHVADIRRRLGRARGDDAPLFAESAA